MHLSNFILFTGQSLGGTLEDCKQLLCSGSGTSANYKSGECNLKKCPNNITQVESHSLNYNILHQFSLE